MTVNVKLSVVSNWPSLTVTKTSPLPLSLGSGVNVNVEPFTSIVAPPLTAEYVKSSPSTSVPVSYTHLTLPTKA